MRGRGRRSCVGFYTQPQLRVSVCERALAGRQHDRVDLSIACAHQMHRFARRAIKLDRERADFVEAALVGVHSAADPFARRWTAKYQYAHRHPSFLPENCGRQPRARTLTQVIRLLIFPAITTRYAAL